MMISFCSPVDLSYCAISQDYAGHLETAKRNGWCSFPGNGCTTYYYPGVDLYPLWSAPARVPVSAPHDGKIIKAGPDTRGLSYGYGFEIRISVPGEPATTFTILAHLDNNDKVYVKVGDTVKKGDILAYMDNTGFSTGKHIHWEHRVAGRATDPWKRLTTQCESEPVVVPPEEEETGQEDGEEVAIRQGLDPAVVEALKTIPWFEVTCSSLKVRGGPSRNDPEIGLLKLGEQYPFVAYFQVSEKEAWLRFGPTQHAAVIVEGHELCRLFMP